MKNKHRKCCINIILICFLSLAMISGMAGAQQEEVTLIGEINDTYHLVADGEIYEIDDTAVGNDLAQNYVSMKVKVTGTIREGYEIRIITVSSFEVVEE
jgi:hypothetical protein